MTRPAPGPPRELPPRLRLLAAAMGVALACPWVAAAMLQPDSRGHGTHQQLGLPPCSFEVLFGRRCPTCGSTTAFSHLVRGQWRAACEANAGGVLLGAIVACAGPWLLVSAARGRWLGLVPSSNLLAALAAAVVVTMLANWIVRLAIG